mgnify:CR=1 FL=1
MTKRNYKLTDSLEFRTSEHVGTGVYHNGDFMRVTGGAENSLIDRVLDLERRLAEANALLDQIYQYVDTNKLAKLGECKVQALIQDNHSKALYIR